MKFKILTFFILIASLISNAQDSISISFIGNEGVLISSPGRKVIIDAFFKRADEWGLIAPSVKTLNDISNAQSEFDNIDLLIVTHDHIDHYNPVILGNCLKNNKSAILVTTADVNAKLNKKYSSYTDISNRIYVPDLVWKEVKDTSLNGINISCMNVKHHAPDVVTQYAFLVEIGGHNVLHTASSDGSFPGEYEAFLLNEKEVDIALLHEFFLFTITESTIQKNQSGKNVVDSYINPQNVFVQHLYNLNSYKEDLDVLIEEMSDSYPIYYFENSLESMTFKNSKLISE